MEVDIKHKRLPNPRKGANFISILTFWWMIPIFRKGYKTNLDDSDLFQPLESQRSDKKGDMLLAAWNTELLSAEQSDRAPSLLKVLVRVFGASIMWYGLRFAFIEVFVKMLQPIALGYLVLYYSVNLENESKKQIIICSSIIVLSSLFSTLIYYPTLMATFHKSLKLKVACASLIYRKTLRLSRVAMETVTAGYIVNLLSADLNSLDLICYFCHNLWIGPLVTIISTVIMYHEIGISSLLGVFLILITIPFQGWLSNVCAKLKRKGAAITDERLELMNEILKGIQIIKIYAWEKPFSKIISFIRRKEVEKIKYLLYIKGLHVALTVFRTRTAIFASILAYVLFENSLTARKVFVVTACFNSMRHTMTDFFTFAIELALLALVSIKRIEKFLLHEEIKSIEYKDVVVNKCSTICLKNVSAKWDNSQSDNTLTNIDLELDSAGIIAIIGAVGSGKSSLLNIILQELPPTTGEVDITGRISYASQEPWLFTASIQQNIIFGNPMDEKRYNEILKICSLERDLSSLQYGDQTLVGDRGASLSGGQRVRINLARAIYKEADIYLLDDPFSALDTNVANEIFNNCIKSHLKHKICILITHQHQYLEQAQQIILLHKGEIKAKGTYDKMKSEIWNYTNLELKGKTVEMNNSNENKIENIPENGLLLNDKQKQNMQNNQEQSNVGRVTWNTYKAYFSSCGSLFYVLVVFILFVITQIFASAGDYFLTYWVNLEQSIHSRNESFVLEKDYEWNYTQEFCIYCYSTITILTIMVTLLSCFMFYNTSTMASISLHDSMFASISQATMRFFHVNPAGRILNRFSKDIETVDTTIPYSLLNCLRTLLTIIGVVVVVAIVNPWLMIPTILAFCIINVLRIIYLTVSSNIKRLENTTRSPLLSYVTTSLQGLATIRANKAQRRLQKEFDSTQDVHTTARFLNVAASRMFAIWLEIICAAYLALVVFSFLIFGNEYGGNVGLAITQVMSMMGSIQWGVRQSSELENYMTSVERIVEYRDLNEKERSQTTTEVPADWPEDGGIEFLDVFLRYVPNDSPVLKQISFNIEPKQKIGIIGRTGSGKSSLINALLQLCDTEGLISIDGINVKNLNLQDLRTKISIIPQEPMLFTGSLRKNLDLFEEHDDFELWKVLKEVHLEDQGDLKNGLDTRISANGSNFSVGQKQLICLARAIIRNNKILVLDEATANIDPETDSLIQKTVKEKFSECTVLTIAHRLESIMDSDKILVMEDGCVKEFDHPQVLLQKKDSYLYSIYKP